MNSGLTNTVVDSLAIDPNNSNILYAGTWGSGVFKSLIENICDFDSDAKTDIAVYRKSTSGWYIIRSSDDTYVGVGCGDSSDVRVIINPGSYM